MPGVILKPSFRVSAWIPASPELARGVAVEFDAFQTSVLLSRAQARKLAKSLVRECDRDQPPSQSGART